MTTSKEERLSVIRALRAAEFILFPCRGKVPSRRGANWRETKLDTYSDDELAYENYAVAFKKDQMAIDIDPRNFGAVRPDGQIISRFYAGPNGELIPNSEAEGLPIDNPIKRLLEDAGIGAEVFKPTFLVKTGGGGLHIYLSVTVPEGMEIADMDAYPGINFQRHGKYVVAPGSIHPDTKRPYVIVGGDPTKLVEAPEALLEIILRPILKGFDNPGTGSFKDDDATRERFTAYLVSAPPSIQGQNGNANAFKVAARGRDFALPPETTWRLMTEGEWNKKCVPPWSADELHSVVEHAYKYARGAVGNSHPEADFRGVAVSNGDVTNVVTPTKTIPVIRTDIRILKDATAAAWSAVQAANVPPIYFRCGGIASRIETNDDSSPSIRELTPDRLRNVVARAATFCRKNGKDQIVPDFPPLDVIKDMLAVPEIPLPPLTRVVEAPVFAQDGTLQTTPGYHHGSKTYYAPAAGFVVPPISANPSKVEIEKAKSLCEELLGDFPFASAADRAHAVALLLSPYARELIVGPTPLHLADAPCPGTGKGLMVDTVTFPAHGRAPATMTAGKDDDEWRKRITAKLITCPSTILIDNVTKTLDSAALAAALTSPAWEDRLLGVSKMVNIPVRCTWIATGNNVGLSSEMSRRTIRIRLDAKQDRPWLRDGFRHPNLRVWATEHRGELVWAALTLIQGWISAGRPPFKGASLGSFESWSSVIGGILQFAEIEGFLGNLNKLYEDSDAEGASYRNFVGAWWGKFAWSPVGTSELITVAEALDLGPGTEKSQRTRLGQLLVKMRDRHIGEYQISLAGEYQGAKQWKLIPDLLKDLL